MPLSQCRPWVTLTAATAMTTKIIFAGTLIGGASLVVLPFAAFAQSNEAEYCSALITRYQTYLRSTDQHVGLDQDAATNLAIDQCEAGDTRSGIPVLEGKLKAVGIELPTHS